MCHKPFLYIHLCYTSSPSLSPDLLLKSEMISTLPGLLRDNTVDVSYQQEKLHSFIEHLATSGIPAVSQFIPFCSWAFLSSMPDHSLGTDYYC